MKTVFLFLLFVSLAYSQINFDNYFVSKTLRFDYFHTGDSLNDYYSFDELIEEPFWGGSKVNMIDKFNYGKYKFEVFDKESGNLIYSRGYSTLFSEWQTTEEAKHTERTFSETVVFPFPIEPVVVKFLEHNRKNEWLNRFE
ncbi:MAG: peptidase M64, partial [Ignavibacteriaceae bacterium]|nr:peptidase M64 [Ignavibacteriaceae bacterium]